MNYGLTLSTSDCVSLLTITNSVSAIKYRNGSSHSLIKIDRSKEYKSLMRVYAEDAKQARSGLPRQRSFPTPRSLPALISSPLTPDRPSNYLELLAADQIPDDWKPRLTFFTSHLAKLQNLLGFNSQSLPPASPEDEAEIKAIEDLVRQLKAESEALIGTPINYTMISLPSFILRSRTDSAQFVEATRRMGIRHLDQIALQAATAIRFSYDINNCKGHGDSYMCDPDFRFVVVSYDKAALTIR
jgi:hypothetical protein